MKKIIVILAILLSVNTSFASQYAPVLDKIENSIYGFTYNSEDESTRLSRIEQSVYGQSRNTNKPIAERFAALKRDLTADLMGQEIAPKEDTFAEEKDKYKEEKLAQTPPSGANVDYPSINELENSVFKKEFKTLDLNTRLAKLEKQALGKTYDSDPFSSRVERLQAKVKPKSFMNNNIAQSSNDFYTEDAIPLEKNYKLDQYKPADFDYDSYNARNGAPSRVNLASVEKSIFKRAFTNENTEDRTFNSDSQEQRINRISSAYRAQKTSGRYDSNKFSQNMATAMQIGTIILMILACVL